MLSVRMVGQMTTSRSRTSSSRERGSWHRCLWRIESGMCCIEGLLISCLWIIFSYYIRKSRSGRRWGLGISIRCHMECSLDRKKTVNHLRMLPMSIHSPSHLSQVKKHDLGSPITTARTIIDRKELPAHLDIPYQSAQHIPPQPHRIPQLYDMKSPSHNQSVSIHLYLPQRMAKFSHNSLAPSEHRPAASLVV